jgi:hypothetical protein
VRRFSGTLAGKNDCHWDLRLLDDSPAKNKDPDGKNIGSSINIQSYINCDFNGDGKRDIIDLPKE